MPNHRDNHPLYASINRKLAAVVEAAPAPPSWNERWLGLGADSSEEERLAVYRTIRDSSCLPADAGFFLVSWQIDAVALLDADHVLRDLEARAELLKRKYGLGEDDPVPMKDGPPDLVEAQKKVYVAWDAHYAAKLEELGEPEMARLFRTDLAEFERRSEAGRQFFHEDDEDVWLDELLDEVSSCVQADSPMGPFGLRYQEEEGFWDITIHPTPVELVGGRHDGEVVIPGFSLDLEQLQAIFDSVESFGWNAVGVNCPEGPYVYVEGVFRGRELYLQVMAYPPEDEEPGLKVDATPSRRGRGDGGRRQS